MIKLGSKAKDKITKLEGVVTGRCQYIYGCDQYLVNPEVGGDNDWKESRWIDEGRLSVINEGEVVPEDVQVRMPGGPSRGPAKN